MKKTLVSLMIIGALLAATPASAATRRWGNPTYVRLWESRTGVLKATRVPDHNLSFSFKGKVRRTVHFDCRWTEHDNNGSVHNRRWRGDAGFNSGPSRGPAPTATFPKDAKCLVR
jgi:hypothetical protein